MVYPSLEAASILRDAGISPLVVNMRFVKPLDEELILSCAERFDTIVTVEENVIAGGFGTAVLELLEQRGITTTRVVRIGYPDQYIEQGEQHELREQYRLTARGIASRIQELFEAPETP